MPQTLTAIVLMLMGSAPAFADPPALKLPTEIKGEVGDWLTVRADTEGKVVRWVALTSGLKVFPSELLRDTKATVVTATRPGSYRLLAYTALGDEPSEPAVCLIVFGDPPPNPGPTPPPGPGPNPPPPPPPPGPEPDAFTKRIRDALATDPGTPADKARFATALAGFYAAMSKHVATDQAATVGDLLADYRAAIPAVLPADAIPATRRVCGEETATVCGSDPDRKIDTALKAKLVETFTRLSAALAIEVKR